MIRSVFTPFRFYRTLVALNAAAAVMVAASSFAQVGVEAAPTATPANQAATASSGTGAGAPSTGQTGGNQTQTGATGAAAAAQGPGAAGTDAGTAEAARVIVTGSNIPTAEEVGPNPVLSLNRDLINKSGERSAEALIKALPVANGGGVPISNNGTGFTPGASAISLRGLGPEATLVLIDGRRVAPYPIGFNGTSSFFDLRSIPEAMIEGIEILKDGASTTYGADAVAGVVNIKLRKDYRGAEIFGEYGNTLDKDSGEVRGSLIFGVGNDNTNMTGILYYYKRNSIFNRDRGYSLTPPFLSSNSTPENLALQFEAVVAAGGTPPAGTGPGDAVFGHAPFGSGGFDPASAYTYSGGRTSRFNFNLFSSAFPQSESYGGYFQVDHKVFGDQMVAFADVLYNKTKTHDELAPSATGNFNTPGSTILSIPPNNAGPLLVDANGDVVGPTRESVGQPANSFNPFNPFQQVISGGTRARLLEFGNRLFDFETNNFISTVGIRGDKLFDGNWGYDLGFRYNNLENISQSTLVSSSRLDRVLNQNDPIFQPGGVLAGQPAFNPFGDALRGPAIPGNAAGLGFATVHPKDVDISELAELDLNIYTTSLFKLPAGGVGFAVGAQFRRESLVQNPDQLAIDGDLIGNSPTATTNASRKDYAFYAEVKIPVFSPEFRIPGFHSLEFTAAGRYEAFTNNDTNVAVPKVGVRWQPFDETLTVRATIGKGFREPSLIELFGSPTSSLTGSQDPLPFERGGPITQVKIPDPNNPGQVINNPARFEPETPTVTTSSPNLQPEDSVAFTGGFVYTPKFAFLGQNSLTISVDVFDIERTGVVFGTTANDVLNDELRNSLRPGEIVQRDPQSGVIQRIFTPFVNSGSLKARGVDFGLQYVYQTSFGTFTSLTNVTYLDSFQFAIRPDQLEAELAGRTTDKFNSNDGFLKWKGNSRIDYAWKGLDIVGTVNYIDGFHEPIFVGKEHYVHQTFTIDGQASYNLAFEAPVEQQAVAGYSKDSKEAFRGKDGKPIETANSSLAYGMPLWKQLLNNTTLTIGCNNIFGQDPPKAFGSFGNSTNYPGFLYDSTGRFVYTSFTKKF